MRKSLHQGTKADAIKTQLKRETMTAAYKGTEASPVRRIVTFNHPWVNQC